MKRAFFWSMILVIVVAGSGVGVRGGRRVTGGSGTSGLVAGGSHTSGRLDGGSHTGVILDVSGSGSHGLMFLGGEKGNG